MKIKMYILKATVLLLLFHDLIMLPLVSVAQSVQIPGFYGSVVMPPRNALPVPKYPDALPPGVTAFDRTTPNKLTIWQNQPKVIIDWSSFNIGADAWTHFDQQGNSSWVALNRIWDRNPSYIFGKLTADGKVYLINQNGILFGPGSKVNVNSLVASTLNIKNDDFLNEVFRNKNRVLLFKMEDYQGTGLNRLATVSNHGEINATGGGYLFLIAPRVENSGLINAPTGQVGLVAGTDVILAHSEVDDLSRSGYYILINDDFNNPLNTDPSFGKSVNLKSGELATAGGIAGMYGKEVEQFGIIRSVTAFKNRRGQIELRAANKVTTGAESVIQLPVDASIDPETGKIVTVDDTFDIQPVVDIRGLHRFSGTSIIGIDPATQIEHRGRIEAPTGRVTLDASRRIFLETGSLIDVSGLDVELPAPVLSSKLNTVELRDAYGQKGGLLQGETITTSVTAGSSIGDLSQVILTQPRTALERSIGGARRTVVNQTTGAITYNNPQTGEIRLTADGDLIVKQGAILDFSGGSVHYKGGVFNTTKLLSGMKVYDITNAPLNIQYDRLLGDYTKTYERFGIREEYSGLYYGGASPLMTRVDSYTVGGDAGALILSAGKIVLDGVIDGSVTQGPYQNTWTMMGSFPAGSDYDLAKALSVRRGLETPRAGTLIVDTQGVTDGRGRESSIEILSRTPPRTDILPDLPLDTNTTMLSAEILNAAGLGRLDIAANLAISTEPDANIRLQPGGSFSAVARRIDHRGKVTVPGGAISLIIGQNQTTKKDLGGHDNPPGYRIDMSGREEIVLGPGSVLDVSGERIDNTLAGRANGLALKSGQTTGGVIKVMDQTDEGSGVSIKTGALLDVSGGYTIDQKGKVAGGNAGLLDIQGSKIVLDGDLRGYALSDPNGKLLGGSVTLRSKNIRVATKAYETPDTFVLAGDRFEGTGFTQIALYSFNNVVIEPGTTIKPSLVRMNHPMAGQQTGTWGVSAIGNAVPGNPDLIRLSDSMAFMAGPSLFTALAGRVFEPIQPGAESKFDGHLKQVEPLSRAEILVSEGAVISTLPAVPGVTRIANDVGVGPSSVKTGITLRGPNVEIRGKLESLGGDITIQSTSMENNYGNLKITENAQIIARGYNRPDPDSTPKNYPLNHLPVSGGKINLSAYSDLVLAGSSLIDISGSNAVENRVRTREGGIVTFREAGDPGTLSLSFGNNLTSSGFIQVKNPATESDGIKGGTLTVNNTRSTLQIGTRQGEIDIQHFIKMGFDDITLKSLSEIQFNRPIDITSGQIGRKLTLDAQIINGSGYDVHLSAPWIVLTNSQRPASMDNVTNVIGGALTFSSRGWIDVLGSVKIGGFQDVTLEAKKDIRLSEKLPLFPPGNERDLTVKGNLTLDASRIYPGIYIGSDVSGTKYSDFIIKADKKVTIQHSSEYVGGPIYSAGGSLTVEGKEGIEVRKGGYLAAPLGKITLNAPESRIYLADGSLLSTVGSPEIPVKYGMVNEGNLWMIGYTTPVDREQLPSKFISLNAGTVVIRDGAEIDVSGGGSVFAYRFQPGIAGSKDPLTKANRYIVFEDNGYPLPGSQIYLQKGGGLSEGYYTLLPLNEQNARYAFMPGAYIIEAQKNEALPVSGKTSFTKEGYPLTIGYQSVADTSIRSTRPQVYSVRRASDVLHMEGDYIKPSLIMGDAGNIGITGATTIIEGKLKGAPLDGYPGGTVNLKAENIIVKQTVGHLLPEGFDFNAIVGPDLQNKLILSAASLSGMEGLKVSLGDKVSTSTVTIEQGTPDSPTVLSASTLSLAARDKIDIQTNTQLNALTGKEKDSGDGVIHLTTIGSLAIHSGAILHATHNIKLDVNNVDKVEGRLQTEKSAITLASENIFFFERGASTTKGLHITSDVLSRFSGLENITFMGKDILFNGATDLSSTGSLTLDAARILDVKTDGPSSVTITAQTVNIKNSAGATSTTTAPIGKTEKGTVTVNAKDQVNLGGGDVFFDGFQTISLTSQNDLTLKGIGSLKTGNADLNMIASRVVTGSDSTSTKGYIAPMFTVDSGTGAIKMTGIPGRLPATSPVPGGLLEMIGRRIELATVLQSNGGTIKLRAIGSAEDGIFLSGEGRILAQGTDSAPGGRVYLSTDYIEGTTPRSGRIDLAVNSLIDVSAGGQGDAGLISLSAPMGGVSLNGSLSGAPGIKYAAITSFVSGLTGNTGIGSLTVIEGKNNIGFTYAGENYKATMPAQTYVDGAALAEALQMALNSAQDSSGNTIKGNPFTVNYSDGLGKLTVRNSNTYFAVMNFMATAENTLPPSQLGFGEVVGRGGSFVLDTYQVSNTNPSQTNTDWQQIIGIVASGGFTEALDIRTRRGDIDIAMDQTLRARTIKLTADDTSINHGQINVYGTINADTADGSGRVELYSYHDLNINHPVTGGMGKISVKGTNIDARGGDVSLSSEQGWVRINPGGIVDVSGNGGTGGTVYLRAHRNGEIGNDANIRILGSVTGQSHIFAEAFWIYNNVATIDSAAINNWQTRTGLFMNHEATIKNKIIANGSTLSGFHLLPGVEVRHSGNMTLDTAWDLTSWRYGNEPGVLTLRAAGNLTIRQNLVDHPTVMASLPGVAGRDSWGFNLVAGGDLTSANYLATLKGTDASGNPAGNLIVADNRMVYTESAPVRFASAGDATIGSGAMTDYMSNMITGMKYNLASYDGSITGDVGRDLIIKPGGAIQTAKGDINIVVGRDIQLNLSGSLLGSIRTTGWTTAEADIQTWSGSSRITIPKLSQYWTYDGGGDIHLDVGRGIGQVSGGIMGVTKADKAWDYITTMGVRPVRTVYHYGLFSANYESHTGLNDQPTSGIAAMGGGDVHISTGGDFLAQAGTFGTGDLTLYAGGDIMGRFLNKNGRAELHASGNLGSYEGNLRNRVQIELFNSKFNASAGGEMQISAILNPDLAHGENPGYKSVGMGGTISFMNCTYTPDTQVSLRAGKDLTIAGGSPIYISKMGITETVLPAKVNIEAGGDVAFLNSFTLTPSPTGNLRIRAGGDIRGSAPPAPGAPAGVDQARTIMISDVAPEYWYGFFQTYDVPDEKDAGWIYKRTGTDKNVSNNHGFYKDPAKQAQARPLHFHDNRIIEIDAEGDIRSLQMFFPKKAKVSAQRDIVDILYEGQNIRPEDVSKIQAGGDIRMAYVNKNGETVVTETTPIEGLIQGGPGVFFVQASGSIDLGTLQEGIQTIGNGRYPQLGAGKSRLVILSGYSFEKTADEIEAFFASVQKAGDDYAQWMAEGKLDDAVALLEKTRNETIYPFLGKASGKGDINMTSSQIGTSIGKSDIFIIANGDLNLGKTALPAAGKVSKKTGITTGGGGAINIFAIGDVNVNESRIMTFYGGDITVWSDQGNINAGRGSRTAVSASPPKVNEDGTQVFSPPAIGSGIRAVTYGENPPEPGNIHLFAPTGIIDAGEAEISGGKIVLAATQVLNVQNVNFSVGSVGIPMTGPSQATAGLGGMTGVGGAVEASKMVEQTAALVPEKVETAKPIEEFIAKWVDVEVIGFEKEKKEEEK